MICLEVFNNLKCDTNKCDVYILEQNQREMHSKQHLLRDQHYSAVDIETF